MGVTGMEQASYLLFAYRGIIVSGMVYGIFCTVDGRYDMGRSRYWDLR